MRPEQFERDRDYGAGTAIAGGLLRSGLISPDEHRRLKAALVKKYRPAIAIQKGFAVIPADTANPPKKRGVP